MLSPLITGRKGFSNRCEVYVAIRYTPTSHQAIKGRFSHERSAAQRKRCSEARHMSTLFDFKNILAQIYPKLKASKSELTPHITNFNLCALNAFCRSLSDYFSLYLLNNFCLISICIYLYM